ncbi:MAG: phosphotransferase [Rhodobacter sp.]|nr:phosphotransferase [Rhodobacter sp.]
MTLQDLAARAAQAWGRSAHPPRLLSHRENAVFEVALPSGRAALRLHRPGYRTAAQIRSELDWTRALAERGFPAPPPVAMPDGDALLDLGGGQLASVIGWMDGAPLGAGTDRLEQSDIETYREVGRLLARLHAATAKIGPGQFERPRWDVDGLTGEEPLWGRYWEMPLLTAAQRQLVITARDAARERLVDFLAGGAEVTLIHTDALRENVFRRPGGSLGLIDFDDSGFGFVMYDLAASVTQVVDDPLYPDVRAAIMSGYGSIKKLRDADWATFDLFAMLRAFSALGWTIPRLPADHPKLPVYVRRACAMAEAFLAGA